MVTVTFAPIALAQEQTPPKIVSRVEAAYPEDLLSAGVQGDVVVQFDIGSDGVPLNLRIVQALDPRLDEKASEAVSKWRFQPGTKDGNPVVWKDVKANIGFHLIAKNIGPPPMISPPDRLLKLNLTKSEVEALVGKPKKVRVSGRYRSEEWTYATFHVWFNAQSGKVNEVATNEQIKTMKADDRRRRSITIATAAAGIAQQVIFQQTCPQIYRIPLLLMNAAQYQWLQACNANGFMLFGFYVFTGGQK